MIPPSLQLRVLDDEARNGETWLLFGAGEFAVVRWTGDGWAFANGSPLPFEPERYLPRGSMPRDLLELEWADA